MFESASDSEGDEFREVSSREVMSREEQLRQDTERLGRAEREFAGHP